MRLAYEKAMVAEEMPQTGGETFLDFLEMFKELRKEEESVETLLRDAENTEKIAGTLILMRDSDPASDSFIEQLQKEACEDREKAVSQVYTHQTIFMNNVLQLLSLHSCKRSRRGKHN